MKKWLFGAGLAVALAITACESAGPERGDKSKAVLRPNALPPNSDGFSSAELQAAAKLFRTKCLRCHPFYDPAAYAQADWQLWMNKMSRKAKLKPEQEQLLSRYLDCFRQPSSPTQSSPNPKP